MSLSACEQTSARQTPANLANFVLWKSDLPNGFTLKTISPADKIFEGNPPETLRDAYQVHYSVDFPPQDFYCTVYSWNTPDSAKQFIQVAESQIDSGKLNISHPDIGDESILGDLRDGITVVRIIWRYKAYVAEIVFTTIGEPNVELLHLAKIVQGRIEYFERSR